MTLKRLRDELQLTKDFPSLDVEVFLNVMRTAEALSAEPRALIRSARLSHSAYNVLRILRGAGDPGLSCQEIVDRMVTRDSDMTRLLDGLERRGLVERNRSDCDRRVVVSQISAVGLELLAELDGPLQAIHTTQFANLSERELKQLSRLLEKARGM